jgi:hypothetical protein
MSKSIALFILCIFTLTKIFSQPQQWQEAQVGDSVTVKFPGAPTKQEMAEGIVYFNKSDQIAFITVVKLSAFRSDASASELKEFYSSTLDGMLEAGGGGKIVNQQAVSVNGFPAIQAQLALDKNPKMTGPYFNQVVLVNGTCYAQSVLLSSSATPTLLADKDRFFNSFSITKHRITPGDPHTHNPAYQLGRLLGTVAFYGGLGAVIWYFLRRKGKATKTA